MNVSSTYLSHIDGFSDVDPNAISSKYSMYMLANTGDNGELKASPSSCQNISDPIPKLVVSTQKVNISTRLSIGIQVRSSSKGSAARCIPYYSKCLIRRHLCKQTYYIQSHHLVRMNGSITDSLHKVD